MLIFTQNNDNFDIDTTKFIPFLLSIWPYAVLNNIWNM